MITLEDIYDIVRDNEKKLEEILELVEDKKNENV